MSNENLPLDKLAKQIYKQLVLLFAYEYGRYLQFFISLREPCGYKDMSGYKNMPREVVVYPEVNDEPKMDDLFWYFKDGTRWYSSRISLLEQYSVRIYITQWGLPLVDEHLVPAWDGQKGAFGAVLQLGRNFNMRMLCYRLARRAFPIFSSLNNVSFSFYFLCEVGNYKFS